MAIFRPVNIAEYPVHAQRPYNFCHCYEQDFGKNHANGCGIMVPPTSRWEDTHVYPENYRGAHVIKPQNDGSWRCHCEGSRKRTPSRNWTADTHLMCEPFISGRELTVAVLDGTALCVTEITSIVGFMILTQNMHPAARSYCTG